MQGAAQPRACAAVVAPPVLVGELSPSVFGLQAPVRTPAAIGILQRVLQVWMLWSGEGWRDFKELLQHHGKLWPFGLRHVWQIHTQHPVSGERNISSFVVDMSCGGIMFVVVSICDFSFVKTKCIAADNQCIILPDYFTLLFLAFSKNLRNLRFTFIRLHEDA